MINQTFLHCTGIGPKTEQRLRLLGIGTWEECLQQPDLIPFKGRRQQIFFAQLQESLHALRSRNIQYLVSRLPSREHWRILAEYFPHATFFDIETTGLSSYDSIITVIVALRNNRLHTFLYRENLDDFLDLVEESELLVSFNGNSFDIPFIESAFNIPEIGCPFIDLRWICYHNGFRGGLKLIEKELHIKRPPDIRSIDGYEAVRLFYDWQEGNLRARNKLVRYCRADVVSTYLVAHDILHRSGIPLPKINCEAMFKNC